MQLDSKIVTPVVELVVKAVVNAQSIFTPDQGLDKKKHAITEIVKGLYDLGDAFLNIDSTTDMLIKNVVIPQAIEAAVDFYKTQNAGEFTEEKAQQAKEFIVKGL